MDSQLGGGAACCWARTTAAATTSAPAAWIGSGTWSVPQVWQARRQGVPSGLLSRHAWQGLGGVPYGFPQWLCIAERCPRS